MNIGALNLELRTKTNVQDGTFKQHQKEKKQHDQQFKSTLIFFVETEMLTLYNVIYIGFFL